MNIKDILAKKSSERTEEEKAFLTANAGEMTAEQKAQLETEAKEAEGMDAEALKAIITKTSIDAATNAANSIADQIVGKFMAGVAEHRKAAIDNKPVVTAKAENTTRLFMRALMNGDMAAAKALTTSTSGSSPDDAKAGLTIPEELLSEVIRIANADFGLARRDMRYLPFSGPGNERVIPVLGTAVQVFWTGEGEKKTSTQPKFSVVTQTLKKLAAIVPFTDEIIEDSAINLTQLIAELFAEAIAKEEDLQFFAGTGSPWTGILNNGSVNIVNSAGDASQTTADDLLAMIDATPAGAKKGAKFYFHPTVTSTLRKVKDGDGRYILANPAGGANLGTIWGYEYEESEVFPAIADVGTGDPYILFSNLKLSAIFGDKQQMRVKLLSEATITDTDGSTGINLAEQDMSALRIVERVGYVLALPKAATVLKASASTS